MAESFTFDDQTMVAIKALQKTFDVKTNAEVINRELALAQVVAEQADDEHTVVVVGRNEPVKVTLTE
jgi:uncharacterized protein YqkB